jgi:hypothetical protein
MGSKGAANLEKPMLEVKIKPGKYGEAIGMLLRTGEGFQTRYQYSLIVNSQQRRALAEAGFVATNGASPKTRTARAQKAK